MRKRGFTLIELAIIMAVVVILAGISFRPLMKFYQLWQFSTHRMQILWGARSVLQDMTREIRMVRDANDVFIANPNRFRFTTTDGDTIDYQFLGTNLYRNGLVFMKGVLSGAFTYYDENDSTIATPLVSPDDTNIRSVEVDLALTSGDESLASQVKIKCRNLN